MAGSLSLDAGLTGLFMTARHDAVEDVIGRPMTAVIHDQKIFLTELRLAAEIGVAKGLGVAVMFPLRLLTTTIRYLDAVTDESLELVEPNIHHRNETLFGPADPWVLAHYAATASKLTVHLRAGATLPLGRTVEDPFALGDQGLPHQHVQFGTGTFNLIVGAEVGLAFERWSAAAFFLTQQVFYANGKGFHAGDRYAGGLSVESSLWTDRFSFVLGAELQAETAERWSGEIPTDDGNQGRIDFLVGTGVTWRLSDTFRARLDVKVPLVTHVVGGALRYPVVVTLGFGANFDFLGRAAAEPDHHEHGEHAHDDHGDDHGDEHHDGDHPPETSPASAPTAVDWTGVDVVEIASAGEAVDLFPVPGVVTVFDFWAPWCAPCKELDASMAALARGHPGRLAIRKINVVDWESPASLRYLMKARFGLPHLKIYGPDGTLRLERTGSPAELVRAVGEILSALPPPPP